MGPNSNGVFNSVEVYFDDFKVTQIKGPVIQSDSYYPFGAKFDSYSRENSVINKRLYNAGSELVTDLGLEIYLTDLRTYDPWGRLGWWQIDPRVDELYSQSPYNFSFNNPIRYNDPKGDCYVAGPLAGSSSYTNVMSNVRQIQLNEPLHKNWIGTEQHYFENINWKEVVTRFGAMMNDNPLQEKKKKDADKEAAKRSDGAH